MDSLKIAGIIKDKFYSTIFFDSSISNGKINAYQKGRSLQLDIDNSVSDEEKLDDTISWFSVSNIAQVSEVINILSDNQDNEISKELVDDFVQQNKVDTKRPLFLKAYLSPSS